MVRCLLGGVCLQVVFVMDLLLEQWQVVLE
jgi:hypothetical protein